MASDHSRYPLWDLPLRLFHWALAILVLMAWISIEQGEYEIHSWIGFAILTLLLFRLMWGFGGSIHARFNSFVHGPKTVLSYMKGEITPPPGHNPLGALSVLAMLAVLLFQAVSGLFTTDELLFTGPWYEAVGEETSLRITSLHQDNFDILLGLIALHVAAVVFYRVFRGKNLLTAMIKGRSPGQTGSQAPVSPVRAVIILLVAAAIVAATLWLAPD